jgi:YD repeat-containing protein
MTVQIVNSDGERQNGRTTRAGLEITSVYDALDRLVTRSVPANAHAPAVSYSYGYDLTGLRLDARRSLDAAGLAFVYDTAGRLTAETDAAGRALSYAYDADGNRTSLSWPVSGTQSFLATWDYDAIGRVVRIFEAGQRVVAYGYGALGPAGAVHDLSRRPSTVITYSTPSSGCPSNGSPCSRYSSSTA